VIYGYTQSSRTQCYADDIAVGFEHEAGARRFGDAMRAGLERLALSLDPDKIRKAPA
jgi:hypothetical protein